MILISAVRIVNKLYSVPLLLLSHVVLTRGEDVELANLLVSTYLRQLHVLNSQKKQKKGGKNKKKADTQENVEGETEELEGLDSKMVSILLTGVNRAFPYAKLPQDVYESHLDILFDLVDTASFNRRVQGLTVVFKLIGQQQSVTESIDTVGRGRFYRSLYSLLLAPELSTGFGQPSHLQGFFALVFSAVEHDKDAARSRAVVKRLLALSTHARAGFALAALLLAAQALHTNAPLSRLVFIPPKVNSLPSQETNKADPFYHEEGNSFAWELNLLTAHSHPLVSKWAQLLVSNHGIDHRGNPLEDFSLNTFLSRFLNVQPSTKERNKGKVREMQPKKPKVAPTLFSFTIRDFQNKKESDLRPDEVYVFLIYILL